MELYLDPVPDVLAPPRLGRASGDGAATGVLTRSELLASPQRLRWARLATRATLVHADALALTLSAAVYLTVGGTLGLDASGREALGLAALYALVLAGSGFYREVAVHPATELRRLFLGAVKVTAGGVAVAALLQHAGTEPARIALFGGAAAVALPASRLAARLAWSRTSWWGVPALLIASPSSAGAVTDTLRRWPELGLRPVGILMDIPAESRGDGMAAGYTAPPGLAVWGPPEKAPVFAKALGVTFAVVALPDKSPQALAQDLGKNARFFKRLLVMSHVPGARALWSSLPAPEGLLGYCVGGAGGHGYAFIKRALDVAGALVGLALLAPLYAAIGLLVRADSAGPALFRQIRMGRDGRCFHVLKFRTMHADAERRLAELLEADADLEEEYRAFHKLSDDPRVTRAGRVLRRYSLDELPQLWNVLRGEMSLVGPRAYVPREIRDMRGLERVVLQSRPGLTGLWQVSGRNALSFEVRVEVDVHYVQNASPWLDLYILARTVPVALTGEGAS
jgi:Undecaprenyl-phosphate galactose phosphotransferase WbaP